MYSIYPKQKFRFILTILLTFNVFSSGICKISVSNHDITLTIDHNSTFTIETGNYNGNPEKIALDVQHTDIVSLDQTEIDLQSVCSLNEQCKIPITVKAVGAGHSEIVANKTLSNGVDDVFVRVTVNKVPELVDFSLAIGWIYFVAWSVSFYPQIYINFRRKSVVGLNFDFLALNLIGFTLYSVFNLGLYYIPEIKEEYASRYPRGLNPVQVNDIVFAVHATIATILTIIQCAIYERSDQRVSITARVIMGIFALFLFISVILAGTDVIHWLDFLDYCSKVKLTITLIKYIPQAYMNYKRKSTIGWSIGNIFLDFTGGILSMLQMIINAYNFDDWVSIFGDTTKFGLGLFSVIFDIFFIVQHYLLYRHSNYAET